MEDCCPTSSKFIRAWAAFSKNAKVQRIFSERTGQAITPFKDIRWYCWFEVGMQALEFSDTIYAIVSDDVEWKDDMQAKRRNLLESMADGVTLNCELFVLKDACSVLVAACHRLESDGFVAVTAYEELEFVRSHLFKTTGMVVHYTIKFTYFKIIIILTL